MTTWRRKAGNVGDTIVARLDGIQDLVLATGVVAKVSFNGGTPVVLAASVTDVVNRLITVQLGLAGGWLPTTTMVGCWALTYDVSFGANLVTWPEAGPDEIVVW